jgi:uncharacterized membrane protein (UPF0127 family)
MKKIHNLLVFIIFPITIFILLLLNLFLPNKKYKDYKVISYKLQGKNYQLLVADTPAKWEKGLMNFRKLEEAAGMIFLFPDKKYRSFWNKNTLMDLDIYWLDDNKIVGKSFLPSVEKSRQIITVNSPRPVNKVVELAF